jgi:hypothetical protein
MSESKLPRLNSIFYSLTAQLIAVAEPNSDGMIRRDSVLDLVQRWQREWLREYTTPARHPDWSDGARPETING